ncbi:hypothetical protein D3C71_971140 [compost metagenome]
MQGAGHHLVQLGLLELTGREIHRHRDLPPTGIQPPTCLRAGLVQHPFAQGHDQPRFFRNADELQRRHQPTLRVRPPHQRLHRRHTPRPRIHDGLIVQAQPVVLDGMAQARLHPQALRQHLRHVRAEESQPIPTQVLGVVHGHVCIAQQQVARVPILREDRNAQAGAQQPAGRAGLHRQGQRPHNAPRHGLHHRRVRQVGQHHHKLIPTRPGHHIARTHTTLQPGRHLLEQGIAPCMSQAVIHPFEPVQVHGQNGHAVALLPRPVQRRVQPLREAVAVGQVGQGVSPRLALQRLRVQRDGLLLAQQGLRHPVQCPGHLPQLSRGIGCANGFGVVASIHAANGADGAHGMTAHRKFHQQKSSNEHDDRQCQHPQQCAPELALHRATQVVLGHSQGQTQIRALCARQLGAHPDATHAIGPLHHGMPFDRLQHESAFGVPQSQRRHLRPPEVHDHRTVGIPYLQMHALIALCMHRGLPVVLHVERGQQDEAQRASRIAHRVGHLQHPLARQAAYDRFQHRPGGCQRTLKVTAVPQVQGTATAQRITEQGAIGLDGEDAGVLRMFLEDICQEIRAGGLVARRQQGYAPKAKQELPGTSDLVVQVAGNDACPGHQPVARLSGGGHPELQKQPHQGRHRQQRGCQHQPQDPRTQAHRGSPSQKRRRRTGPPQLRPQAIRPRGA